MHAIAAPPARTFADGVGLNVKFSQGESNRHLAMLPELGVHWVRDTVDWPSMEPTPGRYLPFPREFAGRLNYYKEHDIGIVFGLWYDNTTAYPNTPDHPHASMDADAYGRYAAVIAKALKESGVRFVIELYNEPHNSLKDLGGSWNGKPPSPWLDHYVDMVQAATKAVKTFDPSVKLLVDDDMWILHYRFLEKGLPPTIDGLAVHPYVKSWPEFSAVEQDTDWTKPFNVVDADRSFKSSMRLLRDYSAKKLGHTPALWLTEWGWPIGGEVAGRPASEDALAGLLPRAFIAAADAGAEALCWFSSQDNVDGPMGLLDNDDHPRKTYKAFQTMVAQLGPSTSIEHVIGTDHPTSGVQLYHFVGNSVDTWVAWNIDGNSSITLTDPEDGSAKAIDVLNQPITLDAAADHRRTIAVSRSPIYVKGLSMNAKFAVEIPAGNAPAYLFP